MVSTRNVGPRPSLQSGCRLLWLTAASCVAVGFLARGLCSFGAQSRGVTTGICTVDLAPLAAKRNPSTNPPSPARRSPPRELFRRP